MTIVNLTYRSRILRSVLSASVLLGLGGLLYSRGCSDRTKGFVPTSEVAQLAIQRALEAWQAGATTREIAGTKPQIVVTDVNRRPGQMLKQFKILGETPGDAPTFAVQLQLANPIENVKTEYIVVGIDPLWVWRRYDFDLAMHGDHHMPAVESSK